MLLADRFGLGEHGHRDCFLRWPGAGGAPSCCRLCRAAGRWRTWHARATVIAMATLCAVLPAQKRLGGAPMLWLVLMGLFAIAIDAAVQTQPGGEPADHLLDTVRIAAGG